MQGMAQSDAFVAILFAQILLFAVIGVPVFAVSGGPVTPLTNDFISLAGWFSDAMAYLLSLTIILLCLLHDST